MVPHHHVPHLIAFRDRNEQTAVTMGGKSSKTTNRRGHHTGKDEFEPIIANASSSQVEMKMKPVEKIIATEIKSPALELKLDDVIVLSTIINGAKVATCAVVCKAASLQDGSVEFDMNPFLTLEAFRRDRLKEKTNDYEMIDYFCRNQSIFDANNYNLLIQQLNASIQDGDDSKDVEVKLDGPDISVGSTWKVTIGPKLRHLILELHNRLNTEEGRAFATIEQYYKWYNSVVKNKLTISGSTPEDRIYTTTEANAVHNKFPSATIKVMKIRVHAKTIIQVPDRD